jgi:hypothetical protein
LTVPSRQPFTVHEVRFARAIGAVLAARYRGIFDPRLMAERAELFRGAIEDRYLGAFLAGHYDFTGLESRADLIAQAIEVLRVAALSSYENRPISSGLLLLDRDDDPARPGRPIPPQPQPYSRLLTASKSFYRLSDGVRTVFLVNQRGVLLDIVEVERWANEVHGDRELGVPCATMYRPHARATAGSGHVCAVLSPTREIKIFAEGTQVFTFRHADWHLLDLQAKYEMWAAAVGAAPLANRLFQTALDLTESRRGALFVVLRDPDVAVPHLLSPVDRLDTRADSETDPRQSSRRDLLLHLLTRRRITDLDPTVLGALATMDGATVTDQSGRLIAAGAILLHPPMPHDTHAWVGEGARTTAAVAASRFGPVLKVSEDGVITSYDGEKVWDI